MPAFDSELKYEKSASAVHVLQNTPISGDVHDQRWHRGLLKVHNKGWAGTVCSLLVRVLVLLQTALNLLLLLLKRLLQRLR